MLVDSGSPGDLYKRLGVDELAGGPIDNIEKTVLGCLHQDLACLAIDGQVREDDVLRSREVPGLSRRCLVVPDVFAGVRSHRDNGGQEQVVAAIGAADVAIPRRAVADAEVQQVQFGVIGHRVPDGAAAAIRPPLARPGFRRILERLAFEAVGRVARHRVETPVEFPRVRVIRAHVAAHTEIRTAVADNDPSLDDSRGTGNRVGRLAVDGIDAPAHIAGCRVQ